MEEQPECEDDSSLTSSDEVNNVWNSASTHPVHFHSMVLVQGNCYLSILAAIPNSNGCHVIYGVELRSMEAV
jgi:hypothetical protein